jgi:hypothetical protein
MAKAEVINANVLRRPQRVIPPPIHAVTIYINRKAQTCLMAYLNVKHPLPTVLHRLYQLTITD